LFDSTADHELGANYKIIELIINEFIETTRGFVSNCVKIPQCKPLPGILTLSEETISEVGRNTGALRKMWVIKLACARVCVVIYVRVSV